MKDVARMTKTVARNVRITTRTVGQHFGTCAVVKDAKTGRKLAEGETKPYGFTAAAVANGEDIAKKNGWTVLDSEEA